jgi:hypothetical protein
MVKRIWLLSLLIFACQAIGISESQVARQPEWSKHNGQVTADSHFESQASNNLDVREAGVDCGFSRDSSAALNAITSRPPI